MGSPSPKQRPRIELSARTASCSAYTVNSLGRESTPRTARQGRRAHRGTRRSQTFRQRRSRPCRPASHTDPAPPVTEFDEQAPRRRRRDPHARGGRAVIMCGGRHRAMRYGTSRAAASLCSMLLAVWGCLAAASPPASALAWASRLHRCASTGHAQDVIARRIGCKVAGRLAERVLRTGRSPRGWRCRASRSAPVVWTCRRRRRVVRFRGPSRPPRAAPVGSPSSGLAFANGCFAAFSAVAQGFVTIDGGGGYRAGARVPAKAIPFYFKPTGIGTYMIQDRDGKLVSL